MKSYIQMHLLLERLGGNMDMPYTNSEESGKENIEKPVIEISVYGTKKQEVKSVIDEQLDSQAEPHVYETWVNVSAMRRLGFLFEGGVESAGGVIEIVLMFLAMAIVLALFAFWQLVVYSIVFAVLAIFSGGGALKFIRGTFIEFDADKVQNIDIDLLVSDLTKKGAFVHTKGIETDELGEITSRSLRATNIFKIGIYLDLVIATVFLIVQVLSYIFLVQWLTDLTILGIFGIIFLIGILIMDVGLLFRRNLKKDLEKES